MMLNEKELNFEKIISKIGFPITFEDYRATYKYNADFDKVSRFETELKKYIGIDFNKSLETIKNNKDIFDTELYLFHVGRYLEKDYKASKESEILHTNYYPHVYYSTDTIRPTIATVNYCNNLLKEIDVVDIAINSKNGDLIIDSSQELFGNKDLLKDGYDNNFIKIQKIQEQLGLKNVIKHLEFKNIIDFCKYSNLGNLLSKKYENQFKSSNKDKNEFFENIIMKYLSYFDIDKMLIIANYNYYKNYTEQSEYSNVGMFELLDFTNKVESIIENKFDSISIKLNNDIVGFQSVKSLVNALKRCFINGKYYSMDQINDLSKKVISGEIPIEMIDKETFKNSFSYNINELAELIMNEKILEFLYTNEYLSKEEILKIYDECTLNDYTICKLYDLDIINNEFIVNKYLEGNISINTIKFIKRNSFKNSILENAISNFDLMTVFLDENKISIFNKYKDLYIALILDGKSDDEKNKIGFDLLDQVKNLLDIFKIKQLYDFNIITKKNFEECMKNKPTASLFMDDKISISDIKKLYEENIISEDMIKKFILNNNTDIPRKIALVFSLFSSNEKSEIRGELLTNIFDSNNKDDEHNINNNLKNLDIKDNRNIWEKISNIDNEYSQAILDNGYILFYLPKKEIYIIKNIFNGNSITYGTATFVLTKVEYNKNKDLLIINNVLNENYLSLLYEDKKAYKIIHTGWGNSLNEFIDNIIFNEQ